jgi:hypothetical protein
MENGKKRTRAETMKIPLVARGEYERFSRAMPHFQETFPTIRTYATFREEYVFQQRLKREGLPQRIASMDLGSLLAVEVRKRTMYHHPVIEKALEGLRRAQRDSYMSPVYA